MSEEQNGMIGSTTTPGNPDWMAQGQGPFAGAQAPGQPMMQAPGQPMMQAPKKKKKFRIGTLICILLPLLVIGGSLFYFLVIVHTPKFEIEGFEFTTKTKVKDLLENGIVLCNSAGEINSTNKTIYPKTILTTYYNLGVKTSDKLANKSGFVVQIANFTGNSKPMEECMIYCVWFYPDKKSPNVKIRIDGQDWSKMARDENLKDMVMESGMPFEEADVAALAAGKTDKITAHNPSYVFQIYKSKDSEELTLYIYRNVKVNSSTTTKK